MTTDNNMERPQEYTLKDALDALATATGNTVTLPPPIFYGLSDLPESDIVSFKSAWGSLPQELRTRVARQLVDTSESNFEFQYERVALALLDDPFYAVRVAATELLWEAKSMAVLERLLALLSSEDEDLVKAEILKVLGRYIRLGEYKDIPQEAASKAQDAALGLWQSDTSSSLVRRRALEAISNSSIPNLRDLIRDAYEGDSRDMQVSAVYAMGRSCDPFWGEAVLRELESGNPEMQYEAVRASGEIEIDDALPTLARLMLQADDRELQEVSIWAMGEIGGDEATRYLTQFAEALEVEEDEDNADLQEYIEDAIHNAKMRIDLDALGDRWKL